MTIIQAQTGQLRLSTVVFIATSMFRRDPPRRSFIPYALVIPRRFRETALGLSFQ
jgi:hypothetical protein